MNIIHLFLVTSLLTVASLYGFIVSVTSCLFGACQISNVMSQTNNLTFNPLSANSSANIMSAPLSVPIPNPPKEKYGSKSGDNPETSNQPVSNNPEETLKDTLSKDNTLQTPELSNQSTKIPTKQPTKQLELKDTVTNPQTTSPMVSINNLQTILHYQSNDNLQPTLQSPKIDIPSGWELLHLKFTGLPTDTQKQIANFYAEKFYQPVWVDKNGVLNKNAQQTHDLINQEIYFTTPITHDFFPKIPDLKYQKIDNDKILQKDLEYTLNLFPALNIIRNGVTQLKLFGIPENAVVKSFDFKETLTAFSRGDITGAINHLTDFNAQYNLLKNQIKHLDDLKSKGGYIAVPYDAVLNQGMTSPNISAIRKRLEQAGFTIQNLDSNIYDADLVKQIIAFQVSRGIEPEGVINAATYNALNQTINQDLKILLTNIERIRHTTDMTSHPKYVAVNVPEMILKVNNGTKNLLSMRTIVGRTDRKTPIFNNKIDYIDFYPYWNVPYSLATKDILPKLKKNANYATTQNIKIFHGDKILNPRLIKWHTYSLRNFPFTLRQEPGENNALGTVKFMFPNHHAVYLHDTPSKNIFNQYERSESSGCIRVSKPKELASLLLSPQISQLKINQFFANGRNKAIKLPVSVPISISYHTAFVENNLLHIRPDIYGYDQQLFNQLLIELSHSDN